MTNQTQRRAYSTDETASQLGISRRQVYRLIDEGRLRRVKVGSRTLIPATSIDQLLDEPALHLDRP